LGFVSFLFVRCEPQSVAHYASDAEPDQLAALLELEAMSEHYTRNTETVTAWCAKCNRVTEHRVDNGRKGPCIDPNHPAPLTKAAIPPFNAPGGEQKNLFED
jgi:hypothetical protein